MRTSVEDTLDFKLTKAQKKLVEDNFKVIGYVYRRIKRSYLIAVSYDEIFGDAAIGLCRAAKYFDEKRHNEGNFFPLAYRSVQFAVFNSVKKSKKYYHNTTSLNEPIFSEFGDDEEKELGSIIPAPDDWESLEYKILVESIFQRVECILSDGEKKIFRPWLNGVEYQDIAKKLRITPYSVMAMELSIQEKCRAAFRADEIFS
ncbi:hypothetical protein [Thermocaproicibacter melissae]|jgi:DNA-directed RNA polymerase specialized sigma24 family protein|uniref:hypothetical protein n=1 Tax=Thermocaproicibacter melissae TaxID=2966552 RepID=UPI0024B1B9A0|nr:hypothetical protein [Thermocaproicibacter melissae]WBY63691.1 hypothetical protein NOG13_06895 [Thermocaproicibacter melissae]